MMNFTNFRIWWFERLWVETSLKSYFLGKIEIPFKSCDGVNIDMETELDALCKEDYTFYQEEMLKVAAAVAAATRSGSLGIKLSEQIVANLKQVCTKWCTF